MHPVQISSTISILLGKYHDIQEGVTFYIGIALNGFSMLALFVLNIERFLALKYPFIHQTSVTKQRLIFILMALMILFVSLLSLSHFNNKTAVKLLPTIGIAVLLLLFINLNYKMFVIARSKRDKETAAKSSRQERRSKLQVKRFSTCLLTVFCYFVCSWPYVTYRVLRLTSNKKTSSQEPIFYNLWTSTFVGMNSTVRYFSGEILFFVVKE